MGTERVIRLLVVEDNAAYLYLIKRAFGDRQEDTRWKVTVANDGEEALRILFEEEDENPSRSRPSGLEPPQNQWQRGVTAIKQHRRF